MIVLVSAYSVIGAPFEVVIRASIRRFVPLVTS
jgi:hypothetical protein